MSLTRKLLESMGLEADKVATIIENHVETVEGLKKEINLYKADAEKLADVQAKLDKANESLKQYKDVEDYKAKYEKLNEDFENYKTEITQKATRASQENAFKKALAEAGVSEKLMNVIADTKKADELIKAITFDKDGNVKGLDKLTDTIKTDYADYISTSSTSGVNTSTPASNAGKTLTKEQIYETDEHGRYKLSTSERQEALIKLAKGE